MTRTVLITGAASGVGAATAAAFKALGDRVIGLDIQPVGDACDRSVVCDLADPASVGAALAALEEETLDVIVSAAGLPGSHAARQVLAVNFFGHAALTDPLLPRLADDGAVIVVASGAGYNWRARPEALRKLIDAPRGEALDEACRLAPDGNAAYGLSKELMIFWTFARAAQEWARGVRVNVVSPGGIETPILKDFRASMGGAVDWAAKVVGRHAAPADIADPIVFLASPAARWVNGADLTLDGGLAAGLQSGALEFPTAP